MSLILNSGFGIGPGTVLKAEYIDFQAGQARFGY